MSKPFDSRFECEVCGRMRTGLPQHCNYCSLAVCEKCWCSQGKGRGHLDAEHRHEMAMDGGSYTVDTGGWDD